MLLVLPRYNFPLLYILQSFVPFLTGTDLHNVLNLIYEDLTVSDVAGVENFLGCLDHLVDRDLADNHFYFHIRKQGCIHFNTTVFLAGTFLDTATAYLRYRYTCYTE